MNRKLMIAVLAGAWLTGGWLAAFGQEEPGPDPAGRKPGLRIRENIITLKLVRMTQALDLTTDQTSALFPTLTRLEKEKYEITEKLNQSTKSLRLLLDQDNPEETKILGLMSEIGSQRDQIQAKDKEMAEFLKTKLSVVQNAKYLLFSAEFYQRLGERLGQLRRQIRNNKFRFTS